MKKMHYYSPAEDKLILENVKKYVTNINYSFKISSQRIGVTQKSVKNRYYNVLKNNPDIVFILGSSRRGFIQNKKNIPEKMLFEKQNELTPLQKIIGEMLNLSDFERKQILMFFKTN